MRIRDNDEVTASQGILTPVFQCCVDNPGDPILLYNLYSEKSRQEAIDDILECSKRYTGSSCEAVTNFVPIERFKQKQASSSILFQPIYPASDPSKVSGIILSPLVWADIFVSCILYVDFTCHHII